MATLDQLLLNTETHDEFLRRLMSSLVQATRKSNELPKGLEHSYGTTFEDFRQAREEASDEAGKLIVDILGYCDSSEKDSNKRSFSMSDDLADPYFYDQIVETINSLLDQADIALEKKKPIISSLRVDKEKIIMENVKNIEKPQLTFYGDIDNSRRTIFKPKMLVYNHPKFHQKVPFTESDKIKIILDAETSHEIQSYTHPYEYELQNLQFPDFVFLEKKPQLPTNSNHYHYIDTLEKLEKMIEDLSNVQEIALDLEHHSVRTFQGLTCLMQISSRSSDYIIDTLVLRLDLYRLGKIFANPNILKVFHGGERDILWLQRDLGLYVVNAFDTFIGARVLQFPTLSLAHLCRHYYGLVIDKKYQLADWRVRPLPDEMLEYARKDTHYLLYIYDRMKADLISRGGRDAISDVLYASKKICMGKYDKPGYDPVGYRALFAKFGASKTLLKLEELTDNMDIVLRKLWEWRDRKARQEDESCEYIMSNSELLRIGTNLPNDLNELKRVCAPISSYVEENAEEVLSIVRGDYNRNYSTSDPLYDDDYDENEFEFLNKISSNYSFNQGNVSESAKLNTVYSFTPSVVIMPQELRKVLATKTSSIPDKSLASDTEGIFRYANWQLNSNKKDNYLLNLPNIARQNLISEENRIKMSNSLLNLVSLMEKDAESQFEAQLENLVNSNEDEEDEEGKESNFIGEENNGMILELPKSYEEIYQLSNRNRKKNRDKKKNKEPEANEDDTEPANFTTSISMVNDEEDDEDFDFNKEFPHDSSDGKSGDTSVQSTLNFAKEIGWIKSNEDAAKLEQSYNDVLAYQQNIDRDSLPGTGDNLSSTQNPLSLSTSSLLTTSSLTSSFKNRNKKDSFKRDINSSIPNNIKVSNSFNGVSSKKSNFHSNSPTNNSSTSMARKSFDYGKMGVSAMGVLADKNSTSSTTPRGNKPGGFSKNNNKRQHNNPYTNMK